MYILAPAMIPVTEGNAIENTAMFTGARWMRGCGECQTIEWSGADQGAAMRRSGKGGIIYRQMSGIRTLVAGGIGGRRRRREPDQRVVAEWVCT